MSRCWFPGDSLVVAGWAQCRLKNGHQGRHAVPQLPRYPRASTCNEPLYDGKGRCARYPDHEGACSEGPMVRTLCEATHQAGATCRRPQAHLGKHRKGNLRW